MAASCDPPLNPAQWEAVTAPDGPVLVIAAAGTGKTQTLTHRVAWLVSERKEDPRQILLLTFTNRAAAEMLERAARLVGREVGGLWGGTFHHAANRLLRQHADRLGYGPDFSILDEEDSLRVIRTCLSELKLTDKKFPKPPVLAALFGLAASRGVSLEQVLAERVEPWAGRREALAEVRDLYQRRKRELNAMDFDDLLVNGLRLLREHPEIAARYQKLMRHVLVDEYQDTNRLQADFVDLLAARHRNVLAVGDDFQSIYSWRGADVRNILSFPERYPDARIVKLEENYRSTPGILAVANRVIASNPEQFQKTLRATRPEGTKPVRVVLLNGQHQARYIVGKIRQLLASGAVPAGQIAVLYRAHYQSMELQMELTRARMDYVIVSGVRFFEQAHIKDVCTLPRLAANPADGLAFVRLVEMFPQVGPQKAQTLWQALGGHFHLRDAEQRARLAQALPAPAAESWRSLVRELFPPSGEDGRVLDRPDELMDRFVRVFYREYAEETFDNAPARLEDVEELQRFAARYPDTAAFLGEMALLTNLEAEHHRAKGQPAKAVRLTTVHQAKGLEWQAVFVIWLAEGFFPAARSLAEAGNEAEERRLFYVAVTRARDYLWLCQPRQRRTRDGSTQICLPSRFLEELDPRLLQMERPAGDGPMAWAWPPNG